MELDEDADYMQIVLDFVDDRQLDNQKPFTFDEAL
jgi:hypothetical protein